jgi:hypothetical protein
LAPAALRDLQGLQDQPVHKAQSALQEQRGQPERQGLKVLLARKGHRAYLGLSRPVSFAPASQPQILEAWPFPGVRKMKHLIIAFLLLSAVQTTRVVSGSGIMSGVSQNGATVTFGNPYGPPLFGAASTSSADPGLISSPFGSGLSGGVVTTCTGLCQNSTNFDTTIPGRTPNTECITDITDGTTFSGGKSVGNMTGSGGDNGNWSSINEDYIMVVSTGGAANLFHVATQQIGSASCLQVINTGTPALNFPKEATFSGNTGACVASSGGQTNCDQRLYYMSNNHTVLHQVDFDAAAANVLNDQVLVDSFGANACPGITPFVTNPNNWAGSILTSSSDDTRFAWEAGPSGQGSADWVFVWDRSLGCFTANMNTGNWYTFCQGPSTCDNTTVASGTYTTGCWGSQGATGHGIHDIQMNLNGLFVKVSGTDLWTQGYCGLVNIGGAIYIGVNSSSNVWIHGGAAQGLTGFGPEGYDWDNHESDGISSSVSASFAGPNIRQVSSPGGRGNQFSYPGPYGTPGGPACQDVHGSWFHLPGNVDTYPWIEACDSALIAVTSAGTGNCPGGTSAVYCPKYLQNTIFATFPTVAYPPGQQIRVFTHTFSCNPTGAGYAHCTGGGDSTFGAQNAIGYVTQRGNYFCWVSSMLMSRGNDDTGSPRNDAFCVHLQ